MGIVEAIHQLVSNLLDYRDVQDLQAQMDMAFWAKVMTVATFGSLIVSLVAVVAAFASFLASRKAARESREVGESQTQAYVFASAAEFGSFGNIVLTCKNSGLTPAVHFSVNAVAKIVKRGKVSQSISFSNDGFKTWSALGANSQLTVSLLEEVSLVSKYASHSNEDEMLLVSGQITYRTIFNHEHLTQFAFYVDARSKHRFRRPTAKLIGFQRIPTSGLPVHQDISIKLDDNGQS